MLTLYSKQLWRNNNIICRSERSLEAILSTKLAGRSPQSLKEDDWEQKSIKGEELSDLLSSAIFINFIRGTSPCHGSSMLHGESCFGQYKEAFSSLRAFCAKTSAAELCVWKIFISPWPVLSCSPSFPVKLRACLQMLGNAVVCRWVPVAPICQFAEDFNCVSETRSGEKWVWITWAVWGIRSGRQTLVPSCRRIPTTGMRLTTLAFEPGR